MAITLFRDMVFETDIVPKIRSIATIADNLMGAVTQGNSWCDDILTEDHFNAGKFKMADGTDMPEELFDAVKQVFAALALLKVAANTAGQNGEPSLGAILRPYM